MHVVDDLCHRIKPEVSSLTPCCSGNQLPLHRNIIDQRQRHCRQLDPPGRSKVKHHLGTGVLSTMRPVVDGVSRGYD